MSFENLGLSLLAFFLQLFVVVITIAVCKAKLLYLGINAALFFLISHTTPSYVPLTWLCFARRAAFCFGIAFGYPLGLAGPLETFFHLCACA